MSQTTKPDSNSTSNITTNQNRGALEGLRVVEIGSLVAAPFCGKLLADLGADVVKLGPPGRR